MRKLRVWQAVLFAHFLKRLSFSGGGFKADNFLLGAFSFAHIKHSLNPYDTKIVLEVAVPNVLQRLFVFLAGICKQHSYVMRVPDFINQHVGHVCRCFPAAERYEYFRFVHVLF
jgi:hypothetical protein